MLDFAHKYSYDRYFKCYCFIWVGKRKQQRRVRIGGFTKEHAIERMKTAYPPPRYFGWGCDNVD